MGKRSETKSENLDRLIQLLLAHPKGLRRADIARRLDVHRSTAASYLNELSLRVPVYEPSPNHFSINRDTYEVTLSLTMHEILAIHLATRLLTTRTDKYNPHAASTLRKLGLELEGLAPLISEHISLSAKMIDSEKRRRDPIFLQVLETLTKAWSQGVKVKVTHEMEDGQTFAYTFAPYFIEPYAVGRTMHVIGFRESPEEIRTFKIERLRTAHLLEEEYTIPDDFDPREQLKDAWGIWFTEEEPVTVELKFSPRVAKRVRETQWHHTQEVEELEDGSLLWRAQVATWREMLPWIRGWGGDCEVVAPEELRDALVSETRRLADSYGVKPIPVWQRLWAKTNDDKTQTHALICHLIDIAQVALTMWNEVLTNGIRAQLSDTMDLDQESAGRLIAFWAGLHDLGKASPCFQRKYAPAIRPLAEAGLQFPQLFSRQSCPHGTISAKSLEALLKTESGLSRRSAKRIARGVGGHHGAWPPPGDVQRLKSTQVGDDAWDEIRHELFHVLQSLLRPPRIEHLGETQVETNALLTLLSGLVSTADWIGSMEKHFPYREAPIDPERYVEQAAEQAHDTLQKLGWIGWEPPAEPAVFQSLFPFDPNPMQEVAVNLAAQLDRPSLVIIEAPTGIGKTEAALYLADHWAHTCQQRGMYVAMPTMATSNQMFTRAKAMLAGRYPDSLVNLHLIHSQARWSKDMKELQLKTMDEREGGTLAAMKWFLPRKRTLLSTFGVGTVDQTFLSVLQTRHFFVRLLGLGHKTIIFDEVHAYDTYMSTLFQRLLGWLRAIGASVVILSATLPARSRRDLLQAYAGVTDEDMPDVSYPAITWAMEGKIGVEPLGASESRTVALRWIERDAASIVEQLESALCDGGCAAVICNTVRRTQEVYRALRDTDLLPKDDLILFHARFPSAWRDGIEQDVLSRFGKDGERPEKAIVVATQVIEQSLDLDFDLMVSDLAPVDLLIQRAGRLHRHQRDARPAPLMTPRLLITRPDVQEDAFDFGPDTYIYARYVLLRSYLTLKDQERMELPQDTEALIEAVYGEEDASIGEELSPTVVDALAEARREMEKDEDEEIDEAQKRLIPNPQVERLLKQRNQMLEEESPELHKALRALTRLGPPSIPLVCIHRTEAGLTLEPDGSGPVVDPNKEPDVELTEKLARYTLNVSHGAVVQQFLEHPVPGGWRKHPLLNDHRVVIFKSGLCPIQGTFYTLRLSTEFGLEIEKEMS